MLYQLSYRDTRTWRAVRRPGGMLTAESVCHATATKAAHNFPQPWRCSMNQTVAIPATDLPDAPRQPRIPDSPSPASTCGSPASTTRRACRCCYSNSVAPIRADPALLAIQLQRPRGDRVTLVAERGDCSAPAPSLIEHLAHDFARSAILEDDGGRPPRPRAGRSELIGRAVMRARSWGCYKLALSITRTGKPRSASMPRLGFTSHGVSLALHLD